MEWNNNFGSSSISFRETTNYKHTTTSSHQSSSLRIINSEANQSIDFKSTNPNVSLEILPKHPISSIYLKTKQPPIVSISTSPPPFQHPFSNTPPLPAPRQSHLTKPKTIPLPFPLYHPPPLPSLINTLPFLASPSSPPLPPPPSPIPQKAKTTHLILQIPSSFPSLPFPLPKSKKKTN